ncbi:MAG: hypothetical protein LPK14_09780 [Hymenobacteraceae bacterium]|nr:hypothetical protein [Hymenobacteraceae bacterium]
MKLALSLRFLTALLVCVLFLASESIAQGFGSKKNPNSLKAGVSFVWLSDYDSQGVMFNNRYNHFFGDRFAAGLNIGLVSASRYDDVKEIYSIKNTFFMAGLEASYDLLQNESVAFRVGGGGNFRRRSEINSNVEDEGTVDGSVAHIKTTDAGFSGFIENDFNILRNGVAGARIEYFHYTKGTPVLAIGLHLGFKF